MNTQWRSLRVSYPVFLQGVGDTIRHGHITKTLESREYVITEEHLPGVREDQCHHTFRRFSDCFSHDGVEMPNASADQLEDNAIVKVRRLNSS